MKIKNYILRNFVLSTAMVTFFFGIVSSPAQAAKPSYHHLRHANNSIYLEQRYSLPDATSDSTSWYQPARSPAFSDDFGG